jgi:hypothetical protein
VREAERGRQPTGAAVAEAFFLTLDAAKKRIQKARAAGLLDEKEDHDA